MAPVYGLAEATLFVSVGPLGQPYARIAIDPRVLETRRRIIEDKGRDGRLLVGCGLPSPEVDVAIVDPDTQILCEIGQAGEVWISGATIASGYWELPDVGARAFGAQIIGKPDRAYMRTGDLGFMGPNDGQLYLCGRIKDLIIVDGRNVHPEDIEYSIVESDALIKTGSVAAFADKRTAFGERIVSVIEIDRDLARKLPEIESDLRAKIRRAVSEEHGVTLADIMFVGPSTMRKTTSGKIQRGAMATLYADGELQPAARSAALARG